MNNALVWRPRISLADATQRRLWENLRDLRDASEELSLINLQGDFSEICKSALFEMSLRRCMRRLRDASMPASIIIAIQKQPPEMLYKKSCIHRKTPAFESLLTTSQAWRTAIL